VTSLGSAPPPAPPPGVRVVLDARPVQDPERSPVAAAYLEALLGAFDADPLDGESFALLLRSDLDDPTEAFGRLSVIGRRLLPPTGLLRSAAQTIDPFVLRGASFGAAWRAERGGARGAVYHAVGAGSLPIAPDLPVVVTLLDLAPWELPGTFGGGAVARFGRRLRTQQLRDAAAVIVGTASVAALARRRLRLRPERVHVVPIAPRRGILDARDDRLPREPDGVAGVDDAARLGLGERYLVYPARFDARQDVDTVLRALATLAVGPRPGGLATTVPWPPRVLLVGASPDDRSAIARAAAQRGVGASLVYAPVLPLERLGRLVRGARATLVPALSDAVGLAAIESIALGVPVVASAVGALPDVVGAAGLLVPPRDVDRLAVALRTIWADDPIHDRVRATAVERSRWEGPTWTDVADATRRVYAQVGVRET
jgi:glycosyltransferase involved in cell wall biosynthesis